MRKSIYLDNSLFAEYPPETDCSMENSLANTVQRLKNLSNKDLYDILEYPGDYQMHVYDLAKKELESRNLTINEEKELQFYFEEKKEKKQKNQEEIQARKELLNSWKDKFNINGSDRAQAKIRQRTRKTPLLDSPPFLYRQVRRRA